MYVGRLVRRLQLPDRQTSVWEVSGVFIEYAGMLLVWRCSSDEECDKIWDALTDVKTNDLAVGEVYRALCAAAGREPDVGNEH